MLKDIKMILSALLACILWPLILLELRLTLKRDKANGKIPTILETNRREKYEIGVLMGCKTLRFCLRMFNTTAETDEIFRLFADSRKKHLS